MLRNLILVAVRNIRKKRLYSVINIAGLAIGIACGILIFLWVHDEFSYNKFIPKSDRIYQVWVNATLNNSINTWRFVPLPAYEALKTADHNIVNTVVTDLGTDHLLNLDETRIVKKAYYVSQEYLEIFEFPLLEGNAKTVLDDPNSLVITESVAKSLFGDEDPLNQIVRLDKDYEMKVTGVLKDLPQTSSFQFDFLIPWKHREIENPWIVENNDNWDNYTFQVFLELNDPSNFKDVEANIRDILTENGQDEIPREFFLYPMLRWRLHFTFENGVEKGGKIEYVQLFSILAIFILAIACINFMNLSTAHSEKRAKEVGIRKCVGSGRFNLIAQFLGESVIIATIAYVLAIIIVVICLPYYNVMVDKKLSLDFASPLFWIGSIALILFTGILAGSYPAFYLSSFNPIKTLKGVHTMNKSGIVPRKILVVFQFVVAMILIVGTVVVYQQINSIRQRDLGYKQDHLIQLDYTTQLENVYESFKNELVASNAVESMTRSYSGITTVRSNNFLGWPGQPANERVIFVTITSEYDYTKTMGIKMLLGRDFSKDFKSDTSAVIINKAALDLMNLEDPIGTKLDIWGEKYTLIGVMDNVLMGSVYMEVKPLFIVMEDWGGVITLRLNKNQGIQQSLATVQNIFGKFNPTYPFDYKFVDQEFERKFDTINLTRRLAIIFSALAFVITGLGLLGLASFTAEQRTKEIGIRKVLGASVPNLIRLISKDFSILVLISFVLATPLAWYFMNRYLERFPLHITIQWWIFPITGAVVLLFAMLIVGYQARKASLHDPVESLRSE